MNPALDVDAVLAQAGRNAPGRAMTRLAERIEAMVRARVRPVTTEVRSTAAHSVLRSTHLTRLDLVGDDPRA